MLIEILAYCHMMNFSSDLNEHPSSSQSSNLLGATFVTFCD